MSPDFDPRLIDQYTQEIVTYLNGMAKDFKADATAARHLNYLPESNRDADRRLMFAARLFTLAGVFAAENELAVSAGSLVNTLEAMGAKVPELARVWAVQVHTPDSIRPEIEKIRYGLTY